MKSIPLKKSHLGLAFIFLFFSSSLIAQFDFRAGVGRTILGTGDMWTNVVDGELNFTVNNYLAVGTSLAVGRSNTGVFINSSFTQGNINMFISPFGNDRISDFRVGGGFTVYDVSDTKVTQYGMIDGIEFVDIGFERRNAVGYSIIIENTIKMYERYLLGVKLFTQPYQNGDINSGIMLKLGVKL